MSLASVTVCRGKLTDGASDCRISEVSVVPCALMSSEVKTSTGTASSSAAVWRAREPITVRLETSIGMRPSMIVTSTASPGAIVTVAAPEVKPIPRARRIREPLATPRNSNFPSPRVTARRAVPSRETWIPGRGTPALSVATPRMTPPWAWAPVGRRMAKRNARNALTRRRDIG